MSGNKFRGLGWFLLGVIVAPACYMVTSAGATERAKLDAVEAKIVAAHKEIRNLETEYSARASLAQLEQWNGEKLQLAAPAAGQFLASEVQLAALDHATAGQPPIQQAAVIPSAAPRAALQPAVLTREGPLKDEDPAGVAMNERARETSAAKPRTVTVAMAGNTKLLSSAMENELQRLAAAERLKLR